MNFDLYLIRHGQTNRNINQDLIGQSPDEPLSPHGEEQAYKLQKRLESINFDMVFTSPYKRALDTCNISISSPSPRIIQKLREINQGDAIDKSRTELLTPALIQKMEKLQMDFKFPNGESLNDVKQRALFWLNSLMNETYGNLNDIKSIAVFSHGMTIKTLIHHIIGCDPSFTWRIDIDNTSISKFTFKEGRWFLKSINDTNHL